MSGCDWPVDRTCLPALPAEDDPGYPEALAQRNAAEDLAVSVLWALSGRQFGVCPAIARPCPPRSCGIGYRIDPGGSPAAPFVPLYVNGAWRNFSCGCTGRCVVVGPAAVHLPGPAQYVDKVVIGSEPLNEDEYVLEGNILYRRGANWPDQNYTKPTGDEGTWYVEYGKGNPVPDGAASFVGLLAREFLAACSGEACRLPRNVVATTSRGVSRQYDPSRIYASGKTGLSEIDLWLSAVNPNHVMAAPAVL